MNLDNPQSIRLYFEKLLKLKESGEQYPVDFDDVWPLVYQNRKHAVEELTKSKDGDSFKYINNVDYQSKPEKRKAGHTYTTLHIYTLSIPCLEWFIVRKVKPVFEIYRKAVDERQRGISYTQDQISFLLELVPVMGLFSVQDAVEKQHFEFHNNKYDWWEYRADVLGYGTEQLKEAVANVNRKYKSNRQALILTDPYELIRIGVIDLFISLGKSEEYAKNVAELCKNMAVKMKVFIWDDSDKKNSIRFNLNINSTLERNVKLGRLQLSA